VIPWDYQRVPNHNYSMGKTTGSQPRLPRISISAIIGLENSKLDTPRKFFFYIEHTITRRSWCAGLQDPHPQRKNLCMVPYSFYSTYHFDFFYLLLFSFKRNKQRKRGRKREKLASRSARSSERSAPARPRKAPSTAQ
jgi:hypothetical protein